MDKEILAVIGSLYLETIGLRNIIESLKKQLSEAEEKSQTN